MLPRVNLLVGARSRLRAERSVVARPASFKSEHNELSEQATLTRANAKSFKRYKGLPNTTSTDPDHPWRALGVQANRVRRPAPGEMRCA